MLSQEVKAQINKTALKYDLEPALLYAIVNTESAGIAFWNVAGKQVPPIRFEGHYFYRRLSGTKLERAIKENLASPKAGAIKNPTSYAARYALLNKAEAIDKKAAYESVSWGLGQIMGAHWKMLGYNSVEDLVNDQFTLEGQIDAIVRFLKQANIFEALKQKKWKMVAKAYNGVGYRKNKYDTKLAAAYASYNISSTIVPDQETSDIQIKLNKLGYNLVIDGLRGPATIAAIKDFQLKNGLIVDGIYGPITRHTVEEALKAGKSKADQTIGVSASSIGAAGAAISEAAKQLQPLAQTSTLLQIVFAILLLVGIGFTVKSLLMK